MSNQKFDVTFLKHAYKFLKKLSEAESEKIWDNIRKAQAGLDPKYFKKLNENIWEFRTLYEGKQFRLLAFWDKRNKEDTLVIATHGFIKKTDKVPDNEIQRAENLRKGYFENT